MQTRQTEFFFFSFRLVVKTNNLLLFLCRATSFYVHEGINLSFFNFSCRYFYLSYLSKKPFSKDRFWLAFVLLHVQHSGKVKYSEFPYFSSFTNNRQGIWYRSKTNLIVGSIAAKSRYV